jgi:hypothetical protein
MSTFAKMWTAGFRRLLTGRRPRRRRCLQRRGRRSVQSASDALPHAVECSDPVDLSQKRISPSSGPRRRAGGSLPAGCPRIGPLSCTAAATPSYEWAPIHRALGYSPARTPKASPQRVPPANPGIGVLSPLAQPGIRPTVSTPAKKTADESQYFHELNNGSTGHFLI